MDVLLKHFADDAEQGNRMIVVCFSFSPDLCIGITLDIFHSWGMTPLEIDMLNNSHRDGAIDVAVFFNINADTPSGPWPLKCRVIGAFLQFRKVNRKGTQIQTCQSYGSWEVSGVGELID